MRKLALSFLALILFTCASIQSDAPIEKIELKSKSIKKELGFEKELKDYFEANFKYFNNIFNKVENILAGQQSSISENRTALYEIRILQNSVDEKIKNVEKRLDSIIQNQSQQDNSNYTQIKHTIDSLKTEVNANGLAVQFQGESINDIVISDLPDVYQKLSYQDSLFSKKYNTLKDRIDNLHSADNNIDNSFLVPYGYYEITSDNYEPNGEFVLQEPYLGVVVGNGCISDTVLDIKSKPNFDFEDRQVILNNSTWFIEPPILNNGQIITIEDAKELDLIKLVCENDDVKYI